MIPRYISRVCAASLFAVTLMAGQAFSQEANPFDAGTGFDSTAVPEPAPPAPAPAGAGDAAAPVDPAMPATAAEGEEPIVQPVVEERPPRINPDGIKTLYEFRYRPVRRWDGALTVARMRMTKADAKTFDEERYNYYLQQAQDGTLDNYSTGSDPVFWAAWCMYNEQLILWSEYVNRVVLAGDESADSPVESVQWPGEPQIDTTGTGAGAMGMYGDPYAMQYGGTDAALIAQAQGTSLDQQLNETVNPFAQYQMQGATAFPPEAMSDQVAESYFTALDHLRQMEDDQEAYMGEFQTKILDRRNRRLAYDYWRENQELLVEEFIADWNRRYEGEVALIGGVRYELYSPGNVPGKVPPNAVVVITDYRLTPYDILTEDGRLRDAVRQ